MTSGIYRFFTDTRQLSPAPVYLYNTAAHRQLQAGSGWIVFELLKDNSDTVQARISFCIKAKKASSPVAAPFGSCEMYQPVTKTKLKQFLQYAEEVLKQHGIKSILIKNYPDKYQPVHAALLYAVLVQQLNYVPREEVSSIIEVNTKELKTRMKISERQKLTRAQQSFIFRQHSNKSLSRIYRFIDQCRKERGQMLSMSLYRLKKLAAALPDSVLLFSVDSGSELAAAAIVLRGSNTVLYTFYYAHAAQFNKVSPVVYLLNEIYRYAQVHRIKLIDLGTSMKGEKLNEPLLHFKTSVGAERNLKHTFTKDL